MGLVVQRAGEWDLRMYRVSRRVGLIRWQRIRYRVVDDLEWSVRNGLRPRFSPVDREERLRQELVKLQLVMGVDLRVFRATGFVDADVPFEGGIIRIRMGPGYPCVPPRIWYVRPNGTQPDVEHVWLSRWSESMWLWEMLDGAEGFVNPPWTRSCRRRKMQYGQ